MGDGDPTLIERIAWGDREALAQLYNEHQRSLFRYLAQLTRDRGLAEEILQDTLLAVWQGAACFEGRSTVRSWLFGIARRQAHNALRRRGLPLNDDDDLEAIRDTAPGPESQAVAMAARETLAAAINRLSLAHREVLALVFVEGLSYRETATLLEVPEGTVKSRLSNAKRALRTMLGSRGEVEG